MNYTYTLPYINAHFRILDWRYLPYIRPMQGNIPRKYGLIWYSTSILGSWRYPIDIIRCFFNPPLTFSRNFDPGLVSPEIRIARGVEPTNVERLESATEIICMFYPSGFWGMVDFGGRGLLSLSHHRHQLYIICSLSFPNISILPSSNQTWQWTISY